jgi:uncharacterized membrane protein YozB (DUF420 family)
MPFSQGQIIFAIFFIIVFVTGIAWAYRKDYEKNKKYFKGTSAVLITILIVYFLFWFAVKKVGA